jgi:hypothetical protein
MRPIVLGVGYSTKDALKSQNAKPNAMPLTGAI